MTFRVKRAGWAVATAMIVALSALAAVFGPAAAHADTPTSPTPACAQLLTVWARGTEAPIHDSTSRSFLSNISQAISGPVVTAELGDTATMPTAYYGEAYPASLDYPHSEAVGVNELTNYLASRYSLCPNEKIVVGGHSQGAAVAAGALTHLRFMASRIVYAALFGDPNYNGGTREQCVSHNRPTWVKGDDDCNVNLSGIFGRRSPYIPQEFEGKAGSWCLHADPVCQGDSLRFSTITCGCTAHSQYPVTAMGDAAEETKRRLNPGGSSGTNPTYPTSLPASARPGSIIQSDEGHLYEFAGGKLFWFDKNNASMLAALKDQARRLTGTDGYIPLHHVAVHTLEVNRTDTGAYSPGSHMPADNTVIYQYGGGQQFIVKYEHPFSISSMEEAVRLGVANQAVMVPPGLTDLQQHPAHWVQNDLLLFGTDPSVWHYAGDRGFRVPSIPTRDCLSVRWNRGVTLMPASAWNYFPTHPTQQAACDFPHGQVLVGQPSQRQAIVLYGAGLSIGSPEEAVAIGAANRAIPVTDETVDGLISRVPNVPQGHVFRAGLATAAYQYVDGQMHYIGSPATRDCLLAANQLGTNEEVVPGSFISRFPVGSNAYCQLENRQLLSPNGVNVAFIKDGYRRPVTNPAIRDCIAVRSGAGQPLAVSDNVWNSYTVGSNAHCPYETEPGLNFVQESGDPTIWLVSPPNSPGQPGIKRHVGSLCVTDPYTTQLKKFHVWTVPTGETAGHIHGPDWWASGALCGALPQG
jgi:Cutinase